MSTVAFRQLSRMNLCLPLRVSVKNHSVKAGWQMNPPIEHTLTENVSSGGCYFFLSQEPLPGSRLEMEVTIPGDIPDIPFARIYCQGKVVRVDPDTEQKQPRFGVAAMIEHLQDVHLESIPAPTVNATGAAIA